MAVSRMLILQLDLYEIFLPVFVVGVHAGQGSGDAPEKLLDVISGLGGCFDKHHVQLASLLLAFLRCNLGDEEIARSLLTFSRFLIQWNPAHIPCRW